MLDLGLRLIAAYLLGSVMGALLVGRLSGQGDIRHEGSGNAGGTNALRTRGLGFALAVVAIDLGKGLLAVTLVPALPLPSAAPSAAAPSEPLVAACCGVAAVLGHVFPYWYGFRGGKGAATLVGAYLGLAPVLILPVLAMWVLCLVLTGFVGLSTMLAGAAAFVSALLLRPGESPATVAGFAALMALLLLATHRSNITRMVRGAEDRKEGIMLWRRRGRAAGDGHT